MPSLNATSEEVPAAPATKPVIGIIYPPPEVRNIVDKTASFVARNGPEFETRIRQNEINNPKFNFLTVNDPYHACYRHKVKEFQEGRGQEPSAVLKSGFFVSSTEAVICWAVEVGRRSTGTSGTTSGIWIHRRSAVDIGVWPGHGVTHMPVYRLHLVVCHFSPCATTSI